LDIPVYLADLLKSTLKGQSKVNLELIGSEEPLKKVERMVNRLVTAIITAALLIGSSFIATTRMKPTFMGIPLLGFIGFFAAIILGSTTLISIYRSQRKRKKRRF
jgi:ubiquinone biosynthesis protein